MPPKKDTMHELATQFLYACGGDREQYEQTIDAVLGAIEFYVTQLTQTALQCACDSSQIKPDDMFKAISNDTVKNAHVERLYYERTQKQKDKDSHSDYTK